jgi:molecular chaperone GrpE
MQNVRRRAQRDVESAHKFALEKFATELLSVVDNLERAIGAIDAEDESQKAVAEGLELTLKTFVDVLYEAQC